MVDKFHLLSYTGIKPFTLEQGPGGQLKPIQGKTGTHPGHANNPLQRRPTPRLKSSVFRPPQPRKPSVWFFSKPKQQPVSRTRTKRGDSRPRAAMTREPAFTLGAQKHISFLLHAFKQAESRGGHRILPLGAVGNSTDSSDRCTAQRGQLFMCN